MQYLHGLTFLLHISLIGRELKSEVSDFAVGKSEAGDSGVEGNFEYVAANSCSMSLSLIN